MSDSLIFLFGAIIVFLIWYYHARRKRQRQEILASERKARRTHYCYLLNKIIVENLSQIKLARSQLVSLSPMGIEETRRFDAELIRFLNLSADEFIVEYLEDAYPAERLNKAISSEYERWIRSFIFSLLNSGPKTLRMGDSLSVRREVQLEHPRSFEERCAGLLRKSGWLTNLTPQSGDYGVDIIARQGDLMITLQCKCYSSRVGLAAVQEVAAGRAHFGGDAAVVVSEAGYTTAAVNLAHSNNVLLMHPRDLPDLWGHCRASAETR